MNRNLRLGIAELNGTTIPDIVPLDSCMESLLLCLLFRLLPLCRFRVEELLEFVLAVTGIGNPVFFVGGVKVVTLPLDEIFGVFIFTTAFAGIYNSFYDVFFLVVNHHWLRRWFNSVWKLVGTKW